MKLPSPATIVAYSVMAVLFQSVKSQSMSVFSCIQLIRHKHSKWPVKYQLEITRTYYMCRVWTIELCRLCSSLIRPCSECTFWSHLVTTRVLSHLNQIYHQLNGWERDRLNVLVMVLLVLVRRWVSEWVSGRERVGEWVVSGWVCVWVCEWVNEWVGEWVSECVGWVCMWVSVWVSECVCVSNKVVLLLRKIYCSSVSYQSW